MARPKHPPILLLTTDSGHTLEIARAKSGFTFCVRDDHGHEEGPSLTSEEWCSAAIQLLLKCPDAKDTLGVVTATVDGDRDIFATGKTLGRRRMWTATFRDVGTTSDGGILLEWSSSRPLELFEIGAVFKVAIKRLESIGTSEV